ncbi:hypothetical protein CORMATOL_00375 [Corynebacterium matruchotii ATCC 33806]|uniref:Uncharacterized protein n=1 Tax=Corynebacterium matruchotii ATCC 33806 TaxID=566549 RepID=C0E075_9CORY|nr:hypothetical protein CORMATOL_00375 [Corynebacterium matruchotii ATCC 33806]
MPGGKPCWFKVPSLSNLLPVWLVVSGRSPQAKTTRQHTF